MFHALCSERWRVLLWLPIEMAVTTVSHPPTHTQSPVFFLPSFLYCTLLPHSVYAALCLCLKAASEEIEFFFFFFFGSVTSCSLLNRKLSQTFKTELHNPVNTWPWLKIHLLLTLMLNSVILRTRTESTSRIVSDMKI